ncbi:1-deoxy-D-xylulose 5-phosphate reductoisomerase [Candidatus Pelagibacter sp. HIMB1321]|uniref:1-deoxy-D-xylulose 5-phosphate reductoisomerase n=1 Tax=Candidatus Pelagibacter sp. HIMB1321 TaxID=1388755 RepID=UPI000A080742|nr:1-deoxy-D-xylulose 5-phosphate reductoisomerase [Candidatus Pelagibacter sp. HIMB1321]SMF74697.1 1-deoxy-D-xylulose 5-phosphate reductoisomerase [Candidatus Pelagibacter sp. HIMB1321]
MKKKIAILGSTGSLGKILCNHVAKNLNIYDVRLLVANKNSHQLLKQAKKLKAKNVIITNNDIFKKLSRKKFKFTIFNHIDEFQKKNKGKLFDYTLAAISGLGGLESTFKIIKNSKIIAIANKESIICAWNLIDKELKKFNTIFIPVDSEHHTIWFGLNNRKLKIKKIYLTASGGPFLNMKLKEKKNFTLSRALKHPNWKMGSKITIDSATMMNKVFEIIEAKNIFNLKYQNLSILTHPKSYIHSIIYYENGLFDMVGHETDMKIPLINSINFNQKIKIRTPQLNLEKLNNLNLQNIDIKKFPITQILKLLPNNLSLFETVIVTVNDKLVELFLKKKIDYFNLCKKLIEIINLKEFSCYKKNPPKSIEEISNLNLYINTNFEKFMYKKS